MNNFEAYVKIIRSLTVDEFEIKTNMSYDSVCNIISTFYYPTCIDTVANEQQLIYFEMHSEICQMLWNYPNLPISFEQMMFIDIELRKLKINQS